MKPARFLFIVLCCFTLVIVGCNSKNNSSVSSSTDSSGSSVKGASTVTYFTWDPNEAKWMKTVADNFHKENPDISVKIEQTDWANYWTKLKTMVAGGDAWDVFLMNGPNFPDFVKNGVLENLQPAMDASSFEYNKLPEGLRKLYSYNGALYAVPGEVDTVGLLYNKKLFDAAGIPYPDSKKPYTWQQFVDVAKKLTKAPNQWGFATSEGNSQTGYYPWIYSNNGKLFTDDWSKSLLTSPETVEAMKKFSNLILVDKVAPPPAYYGDPSQIDKLFYSGKVGMIVAGTWYIANIAAEKTKIEYDFAPLPYMSKPSTVIHGIGHVVNTKSKNKDAAIKFALYTGLQKNQESMQKDLGWMSFFEGLPQKFASQDPNHHNDVFVDALNIGTPYPATPNMSVWEAELTKQMQLVLLGKSTVEDAMKKTSDKMQEAFSK